MLHPWKTTLLLLSTMAATVMTYGCAMLGDHPRIDTPRASVLDAPQVALPPGWVQKSLDVRLPVVVPEQFAETSAANELPSAPWPVMPPSMLPPGVPACPPIFAPLPQPLLESGSAVGAAVTVDPQHGTRVYEFRQDRGAKGPAASYSSVQVQPGQGEMVGIGVSTDTQHGTRVYRYYRDAASRQ